MRWTRTGSPILLLDDFPQTHLMWRNVAPLLARNFAVIGADLRGYGRGSCRVSTADHAPYAKPAMAQDMVIVMKRLGCPDSFTKFLDHANLEALRHEHRPRRWGRPPETR